MLQLRSENKAKRYADKTPPNDIAAGKTNIDGQIATVPVYPARKCTLVWQWTFLISALVTHCLKRFFIQYERDTRGIAFRTQSSHRILRHLKLD